MYFYPTMCIICYKHNKKNLQSILLKDIEGIVIEEKLRYIIPEITSFKPEIPKNICRDCLNSVNFIYTFKQKCLEQFVLLKKYYNESSFHSTSDDKSVQNKPEIKTEQLDDEPDTSQLFQEVLIKVEFPVENNIDPLSISDQTIEIFDQKNEVFDQQNEISGQQNETPAKKPKLHECKTCNKTFKTAQHLERHNIIHTGLRPQCDVCSKTFSDESGLNSHKRIHNSVKPYKCTVCPKSFTQSGHLSNHMTTHSEVKKFQCDLCSYTSSFSSNLKLHMRVHSGDKPHVCQYCQLSFSRPESKSRHIKRKHT